MTQQTAHKPALFDPLSPEIRLCPHAHYDALNAQPVTALPDYPNFYLVSGYETVVEVLMDPHTYDGQPFPGREVPIMSAMPPDPHGRVRGAVQSIFTKKALAKLTPRIEAMAEKRTRALVRKGRGDLMALWANPIPLSVIAHMFGFPDGERDLKRLHRYGDASIRLAIPLGGPGLPLPKGRLARLKLQLGFVRALPSVLRLRFHTPPSERGKSGGRAPNPLSDKPGYPRSGLAHHPWLIHRALDFQVEVLKILNRHRKQPGDEVIDLLIPPYVKGELSLRETLGAAQQILVAGYETTANTLASAVLRMAEDPGLLDWLKADKARIEPFVEELLRLDAPLQRTLRRTTRPVRLGGVDLPENAQLIVMLGAANLDPAQYDCPHTFDPGRTGNHRHLAFGRGIHICLGAQLARLETRIALGHFLDQVGAVRLDPNRPPERLTDKDIGMWGFVRLPVIVEPA